MHRSLSMGRQRDLLTEFCPFHLIVLGRVICSSMLFAFRCEELILPKRQRYPSFSIQCLYRDFPCHPHPKFNETGKPWAERTKSALCPHMNSAYPNRVDSVRFPENKSQGPSTSKMTWSTCAWPSSHIPAVREWTWVREGELGKMLC